MNLCNLTVAHKDGKNLWEGVASPVSCQTALKTVSKIMYPYATLCIYPADLPLAWSISIFMNTGSSAQDATFCTEMQVPPITSVGGMQLF